jgi:hypothetical protein
MYLPRFFLVHLFGGYGHPNGFQHKYEETQKKIKKNIKKHKKTQKNIKVERGQTPELGGELGI